MPQTAAAMISYFPDVLPDERQRYAEELAALGGLTDQRLMEALARVRREDFLPAGPWLAESSDGLCYLTPDANPRRILHGVGVVIDPNRSLHSGNPAKVARALQFADIRPGQTVLHVGAGMGYFSAVIAELVGPTGRVIAAEIDPLLNRVARANLASWKNIEVVGDALSLDLPQLDRIFASCGMASLPRRWLDALGPDGCLTLPMTGALEYGLQFHFSRTANPAIFKAQVLSCVLFYPCQGLRQSDRMAAFDAALSTGQGHAVKMLRLDDHPPDHDCWLHGDGFCLSRAAPPDDKA